MKEIKARIEPVPWKLSKEEIHRFEKDLAQAMNRTYDFNEIEGKILQMDADQNGFVERREWVDYCREQAGFPP